MLTIVNNDNNLLTYGYRPVNNHSQYYGECTDFVKSINLLTNPWSINIFYPLVNQHSYEKSTFLMCNSATVWPFSIANCNKLPEGKFH